MTTESLFNAYLAAEALYKSAQASLKREIELGRQLAEAETKLEQNTIGDWRHYNDYRWLPGAKDLK